MKAIILNQGAGSWAFDEHAAQLADALWLETAAEPGDFNYLLGWEQPEKPSGQLFIPWDAIQTASDKRLQAAIFSKSGVPTPRTLLIDTVEELRHILNRNCSHEWVLKYPISCGGSGHQTVTVNSIVRDDWPRPFVLQEFIKLENPEVYRLYGIAGEIFGFNARRFPRGVEPSPWVAHARGARYVHLGEAPSAAVASARAALTATGLIDSFGVVDLLKHGQNWVVLEVGTDGIHSHVDRDFDSPELEKDLNRRLAEAFWASSVTKPWGASTWRPRSKANVVPLLDH